MFKHKYFILAILLPTSMVLYSASYGLWTIPMALALWGFLAYFFNQVEAGSRLEAEGDDYKAYLATKRLLGVSEGNGLRHLLGVTDSMLKCLTLIPAVIVWIAIAFWLAEPSLFIERVTALYSETSTPAGSDGALKFIALCIAASGVTLWLIDNALYNQRNAMFAHGMSATAQGTMCKSTTKDSLEN